MSRLLLPDGSTLELPVSASSGNAAPSAPVLLVQLGRGRHGVPAGCTEVSRVAAEVMLLPPTPPKGEGKGAACGRVMLRVMNRNGLYLAPPPPKQGQATTTAAATPGSLQRLHLNTEHEWPVGATLYLLHSGAHPMQFPFVLQGAPEPAAMEAEAMVDPEATQDVLPPPPLGAGELGCTACVSKRS